MHKEEIVLVHLALFHIKQLLDVAGFTGIFQVYDGLDILPTYIYRTKEEHEKAVLCLCIGILEVLGGLESIPKVSREALKNKGILIENSHLS